MRQTETIIRVAFREPPLKSEPVRRDFYFGSLAAIYETFTPEQVGCKVECLWNHGVVIGHPYSNKLCVVSREPFIRKAQTQPSRKPRKHGQ